MAALSREQTAKYLYDAGFRGDDLIGMVAIAGRESGYQPDAHRTDREKSALSGDMGLFQINYTNWDKIKNALGLTSKEQLFDPAINAKAAKVLHDASGFFPWNMTSSGWNANGDPFYGTNRSAASTAVNNFLSNPQQYGTASVASGQTNPTQAQSAPAPRTPVEYTPIAEPKDTRAPIADYAPPTADPKAQRTLTNLLQGFGIEYPNAPRATPQLLAFMRGLGMNVDMAEEQFTDVREEVQRKTSDRMGDLAISDQRRRTDLGHDAQRRGALTSGATNTAFAEQAEDYTRSQADVQRGAAESISAAERARDTYVQGQNQSALETVLNEETRQLTADATGAAEVEALRRAREEADLQYARTKAASDRAAKQQISLYNG